MEAAAEAAEAATEAVVRPPLAGGSNMKELDIFRLLQWI